MIKNDEYYPNYYKKASFLFVALSKGHYFSNGNKRVALFSYAYFAFINRYISRRPKRIKYTEWFKRNFKNYKLTRHKFRTNYGWGLYNLNKAINIKFEENKNGHKYTFDEIKALCEDLFQLITIKQKY